MIAKWLYNKSKNYPCRLINRPTGERYLERYFISEHNGWCTYLHRFVGSDAEPTLHNHPWMYGGAIVLCGSYLEEKIIDLCPNVDSGYLSIERKINFFNIVNHNTFHRIIRTRPETWTLFTHGPRMKVDSNGEMVKKGWGFIQNENGNSVFKTFNSNSERWWDTAPLGKDINRASLGENT